MSSLSLAGAQAFLPGPRLRKLHARIGKAHHKAEGMAFSRALLEGRATPSQLAALLSALAPAYRLLEREGPPVASALGAVALPWSTLARTTALQHDLAMLSCLPATPVAAVDPWLERIKALALEAPHRLMAHVYVRYGGDLSGGQQLARQANAILRAHGLMAVNFWRFDRPVADLKEALHQGFEQMHLSESQERELLEESELAFGATQRLLAELAEIP